MLRPFSNRAQLRPPFLNSVRYRPCGLPSLVFLVLAADVAASVVVLVGIVRAGYLGRMGASRLIAAIVVLPAVRAVVIVSVGMASTFPGAII